MRTMNRRNMTPGHKVEMHVPDALERERGARTTRAPATLDRIRARAYEIYEARRGGPGDSLCDWIQAERELNRGFEAGAAERRLSFE